METVALIAVVVLLVIVVAAAAWFLTRQRRRSEQLQEQFGPEYEQTVKATGDRRRAEEDLEERAKRVEQLSIRRLDAHERDRFVMQWRHVQTLFVDQPSSAVAKADELVGKVMEARGYPVADFERRAADVSVDHPQVVHHYRTAHDIASRERADGGDTEALRQAMVHYRALFADLLETDEPEASNAGRERPRSEVNDERSTEPRVPPRVEEPRVEELRSGDRRTDDDPAIRATRAEPSRTIDAEDADDRRSDITGRSA
jgi:hypothetical protein